MPIPEGLIELELDSGAKTAMTQISEFLGGADAEEVIQRALGTELYLLQQVKQEGAKVYVERKGEKIAIDLFK